MTTIRLAPDVTPLPLHAFESWTLCSACRDAFEIRCELVQYVSHGSRRALSSRLGTVSSVHRSGPSANSAQSSGIDT